MFSRLRRSLGLFASRQQGSVAVEFALISPLFLLLVFGIADFGHAMYMKQVVSNASREAARYATKYHTDSNGIQIKPDALSPSVTNWTISKYSGLLPTDANLQVTPSGPGYTSGNPGDDLSVLIQANKSWFVLGSLMPSIVGSHADLKATTVMKCE
jgi:Flp pilus assembly protein TadG